MEPQSHLGPRLRIINQLICQYMDRDLQAMDITSSQAFVMRYLSSRSDEASYQKDIERRFHLSHPTVSGILQRLESKGFVEFLPEPDDKRKKRIVLTPKAQLLEQDIRENVNELEKTMIRSLTESETAQLFSLLDRITENLKNQVSQEVTHS